MSKLDKSKPFGTVHGSSVYHYEQGGVMFDHEGNSVTDESAAPEEVKPPVKATLTAKPVKPAMDDQLASQLKP